MAHMLSKLRQSKKDRGFTIIEVLIVLAIAGLILLIVFLAVPSLQRNQRNTARKQDVSRVADSAVEYTSNNNGSVPTAIGQLTPLIGTMGQYSTSQLSLAAGNQAALATTAEAARVVTGATCAAAGATTGGTTRQMAVQYTLETSTAWAPYCLNAN